MNLTNRLIHFSHLLITDQVNPPKIRDILARGLQPNICFLWYPGLNFSYLGGELAQLLEIVLTSSLRYCFWCISQEWETSSENRIIDVKS